MSFGPTIAWKASPTRTPPPICTSAPFLKPRWSQDRGRREQNWNYTMRGVSQCIWLNSLSPKSYSVIVPVVPRLDGSKASFWISVQIRVCRARCHNSRNAPKKIHKCFKAGAAKPNFSNASLRYGDKWLAKRSFSRLLWQGNSRSGCAGNSRAAIAFDRVFSQFLANRQRVSGATKLHQVKLRKWQRVSHGASA